MINTEKVLYKKVDKVLKRAAKACKGYEQVLEEILALKNGARFSFAFSITCRHLCFRS